MKKVILFLSMFLGVLIFSPHFCSAASEIIQEKINLTPSDVTEKDMGFVSLKKTQSGDNVIFFEKGIENNQIYQEMDVEIDTQKNIYTIKNLRETPLLSTRSSTNSATVF